VDWTSPITNPTIRRGFWTVVWTAACALAFAAGWLINERRAGNEKADAVATTSPSAAKQLWTCGMHPQVIRDQPGKCPICHMDLTPMGASTAAAGGAAASNVLLIDPAVVQNMGVRLAKAEKGSIPRIIRVVGYLEEPEPLHRDVNLRVGGWIEKLYANIDGMDIKEGQPLFDLYSPEMRGAIEELITARRMNQPNAAAIRAGVERKLELWGLTKQQVQELAQLEEAPATVPILAPMTGHLTEKMVYEGAAVKAGELAMRLASRQQMWLDARVYESQLPLIRVGDTATATVEAMPGRTFGGKIVFIHPHLDPRKRGRRWCGSSLTIPTYCCGRACTRR
jgi:multidrug resistance efflux pump